MGAAASRKPRAGEEGRGSRAVPTSEEEEVTTAGVVEVGTGWCWYFW